MVALTAEEYVKSKVGYDGQKQIRISKDLFCEYLKDYAEQREKDTQDKLTQCETANTDYKLESIELENDLIKAHNENKALIERNKELVEGLLEIQEWQMQNVELARTTEIYKIAYKILTH